MPTYEYQCDDCDYTFEEFQSMKADPLKECPKCQGHVRRLIGGGAGILFKGSGFYETDYRSKSYRDAAKKDKPSSGSETKKTEKKKESKP